MVFSPSVFCFLLSGFFFCFFCFFCVCASILVYFLWLLLISCTLVRNSSTYACCIFFAFFITYLIIAVYRGGCRRSCLLSACSRLIFLRFFAAARAVIGFSRCLGTIPIASTPGEAPSAGNAPDTLSARALKSSVMSIRPPRSGKIE